MCLVFISLVRFDDIVLKSRTLKRLYLLYMHTMLFNAYHDWYLRFLLFTCIKIVKNRESQEKTVTCFDSNLKYRFWYSLCEIDQDLI